MTKRILLMCVAALSLVFAACGSDDDSSNAADGTTTTEANAVAVMTRAVEPFGKILTDNEGRTLYVFDKDATTKPESACTGQCAMNWPALKTADGDGVGDGLDAAKLGTNGAGQYTYNGWPLYRFSGDKAAGDTNGQGVGGVWFIAGADGNKITATAATTTTTANPNDNGY